MFKRLFGLAVMVICLGFLVQPSFALTPAWPPVTPQMCPNSVMPLSCPPGTTKETIKNCHGCDIHTCIGNVVCGKKQIPCPPPVWWQPWTWGRTCWQEQTYPTYQSMLSDGAQFLHEGACNGDVGCPRNYAPVCGQLNNAEKTYANRCELDRAGALFLYEGECRPMGCPDVWTPVCGVDGKTYSNDCYARMAGIGVAHNGECGVVSCDDHRGCPAGQTPKFWKNNTVNDSFEPYCERPDDLCPQYAPLVCNPLSREILTGVDYSNGCMGKPYCVGQDPNANVWDPHCGEENIVCVKAPCVGPLKTYANKSEALAHSAKNIRRGVCPGENLPECGDDPTCGCPNGMVKTWKKINGTYQKQCVRPPSQCPQVLITPCPNGEIKTYINDQGCEFPYCTNPAGACPQVLDPVCGQLQDIVCAKAPCIGPKTTFDNECLMERAGYTKIKDGPCEDTCNPVDPPVQCPIRPIVDCARGFTPVEEPYNYRGITCYRTTCEPVDPPVECPINPPVNCPPGFRSVQESYNYQGLICQRTKCEPTAGCPRPPACNSNQTKTYTLINGQNCHTGCEDKLVICPEYQVLACPPGQTRTWTTNAQGCPVPGPCVGSPIPPRPPTVPPTTPPSIPPVPPTPPTPPTPPSSCPITPPVDCDFPMFEMYEHEGLICERLVCRDTTPPPTTPPTSPTWRGVSEADVKACPTYPDIVCGSGKRLIYEGACRKPRCVNNTTPPYNSGLNILPSASLFGAPKDYRGENIFRTIFPR